MSDNPTRYNQVLCAESVEVDLLEPLKLCKETEGAINLILSNFLAQNVQKVDRDRAYTFPRFCLARTSFLEFFARIG